MKKHLFIIKIPSTVVLALAKYLLKILLISKCSEKKKSQLFEQIIVTQSELKKNKKKSTKLNKIA